MKMSIGVSVLAALAIVLLGSCTLSTAPNPPAAMAGAELDLSVAPNGTARSDLGVDGSVKRVWVEAFDSQGYVLQNSYGGEARDITEMYLVGTAGSPGAYWKAHLILLEASDTISFKVSAENALLGSDGKEIYKGDTTIGVATPAVLVPVTPIVAAKIGTYSLGDIGPAGGWIFYDNTANYSEGSPDPDKDYKYLEVAASDVGTVGRTKARRQWSTNGSAEVDRDTLSQVQSNDALDKPGYGSRNNSLIVECFKKTVCTSNEITCWSVSLSTQNGYSGWFLPSQVEMQKLHLAVKNAGSASLMYKSLTAGDSYWTSSPSYAKKAYSAVLTNPTFSLSSDSIATLSRARAIRKIK